MMPRLSTLPVLRQLRDSAREQRIQTITKRGREPLSHLTASLGRPTQRVHNNSDVAHLKYHWHSWKSWTGWMHVR